MGSPLFEQMYVFHCVLQILTIISVKKFQVLLLGLQVVLTYQKYDTYQEHLLKDRTYNSLSYVRLYKYTIYICYFILFDPLRFILSVFIDVWYIKVKTL